MKFVGINNCRKTVNEKKQHKEKLFGDENVIPRTRKRIKFLSIPKSHNRKFGCGVYLTVK